VQELSRYNVNHQLPAEPSEFGSIEPYAPSEPDDQPDLRTYWLVIWRHLYLILGLFFVAEVLTAGIISTMTPLYTALSTVLIEDREPQVLGSDISSEGPDSEASYESFYKTQYAILQSRSLAARVIQELGLDHDPYLMGATVPKRPATGLWDRLWPGSDSSTKHSATDLKPRLIDSYLEHLTVRPEFGTRLVMVAFTSADPVLSADVANAHVQAYIRQSSERHAQSGETEQKFLETKLIELEKRIEKSERALNDYRRERGIVVFSLDEKDQMDDKDQMAAERLAELNRAVVQAETQRISLQAEVETIKAGEYDSLPAVVNTTLIQNLKSEASKLEGQYANMANEYTPDWPPLAQLHAELLEVQERQQEETHKIVDSIRLRYQSAVDQENKLTSELEAEKAKAMSLKDASLRDVILSREVDTNRALYQNVLERIKMLGMVSESQVTNASIIDKAEVSVRPTSPNKRLCLVLSGFLALLVGIAASFAIEGWDRGLKNADEVHRYLHLPNLATVLHLPSKGERSVHARKLLTLQWSKTAGPDKEKAELPAATLNALGDAYRAVRTGILLSRSDTPPKTILFTSAASGEGKTWTVVSTAIAFAHMVDRILLIDADLRKPRCDTALKGNRSPGLSEVLAGREKLTRAVQPTKVDGLYLLSAGSSPPNPTELLGSNKMRDILAEAAASFEHVLIDSPPILPVSDSVILSRLVDGVVLVASAQTAKPLVREGYSRLRYVGAKLLGVVLNNVSRQDQPYSESFNYDYKSTALDS
jgi:polysaccharide biosynthesis transport protein